MEIMELDTKRVLANKSRMCRKRALACFQEYSANMSKANEYDRQWRQINVRKTLEKKDVGKCDSGKAPRGYEGGRPAQGLQTPIGPCF